MKQLRKKVGKFIVKQLSLIVSFLILIQIFTILGITASAESFVDEYGNSCQYSYDSRTQTLTISGGSNMPSNWLYGSYPWAAYSYSTKNLIVSEGVDSLNIFYFTGFSNLRNVQLPNSLKTIDIYAFSDCTSLETITIPSSVTRIMHFSFFGCHSLSEIAIPSSVTYISDDSFEGCSNVRLKVDMNSYAHQYAENNGLAYIFNCNHTNSEIRGAVKATCTVDGKTGDLYCFDCGGVVEKSKVILANHTFEYGTVVKKPTCTEQGLEKGKCIVCGQQSENVLSKLYHSYSDWEIIKQVSCTSDGSEQRKCANCGKVETSKESAYGHDYSEPITVKYPTKTSTGLKESYCLNCNDTIETVIPKLASSDTQPTVSANNTDFSVNPVSAEDDIYSTAQKALKNVSPNFLIFEAIAKVGGKKTDINLSKAVTLTIDLPKGFSENIAIYIINKNGSKEKVDFEISNRKIYLTAYKTGYYAVCSIDAKSTDKKADTQNTVTETEKRIKNTNAEKNYILYAIILSAAAIIVLILLIIVIIFKFKKPKYYDIDE